MTNSPGYALESPHQLALRQLLAAYGITDTHGVELLRLLHLVANTYENVIAAQASDGKLSAPRWQLLARLLVQEQLGAAYVHPTELSKAQSVSKNTISAHLRSLEEQGLIERELDNEDRRQFRIRLSDAGRTLIRNAMPDHINFLNDLTADLTPAETNQLQMLLFKLYGSLMQRGQPCKQGLDPVRSRSCSKK